MKIKFVENRGSGIGGNYCSRENPARRLKLILPMLAISLFFAVLEIRAQQTAASHASDFNSVQYYDAPFEFQMKRRVSGAEASPQAGGLLEIKTMKLEMFGTNGVTEAVAEAPGCVYDTEKGVASSPGHLQLQTGDGNLRIEGDGFLWRQTNQWLTISNHQHTVIKGDLESKTGL
jgi:hypothetical protein